MKCLVYIACSLDGFIARENGDLDWLVDLPNPTNSDFGFSDFLARVDAIVMGRKTFETVLGFEVWPYAKPVFVLSNTLKSVPHELASKVEIVSGPLASVLARLETRNLNTLYIDGGTTIQSFLKEDLIDEFILTTVAKVLGKGIPLFGSLGRELRFRAVETEVLSDVLVKTRYLRR